MSLPTPAKFVVTEPISVEHSIDDGSVCPSCGVVLPSDAKFCPFDGADVGAGNRVLSSYPRAVRDSLVGIIVDERYEVLQLLGEGGMGCVYRVRHRVLGRFFALKALRQELASDRVTAERFVQEARAAASISHPNIVSINDFGLLDSGQPYFVMELLEGRTLASFLRERGQLTPREAVLIAKEVASALVAAHDCGIIHRDLKPDNIVLLNPSGFTSQLKVLDFGLAMVHGNNRLTRDGIVFGTPRYMSPEQATGEPLDGRVDVYALGIVLYEMLVGRAPFEADSYMGVLTKQLYAEPLALSTVNPELLAFPEVEELVLRCLKKNREERFDSMLSLCCALENTSILLGGPLSTDGGRARLSSVRPPLESRVRRRHRRYRLFAYAAIGAVALGLALTLLYGHWVRSDSANAEAVRSHSVEDSTERFDQERSNGNAHQRVSAVAPRIDGTRSALPSKRSASLSREPDKNSLGKNQTGRSGGRTRVVEPSTPATVEPRRLPNSKDEAKLGSSEIPDPWAQ